MGTDHKIVAHSDYVFNVAKLFILGVFRHSRFIRADLSTTFWERTRDTVDDAEVNRVFASSSPEEGENSALNIEGEGKEEEAEQDRNEADDRLSSMG